MAKVVLRFSFLVPLRLSTSEEFIIIAKKCTKHSCRGQTKNAKERRDSKAPKVALSQRKVDGRREK